MATLQELRAVYDLPLPELIFRAAEVHRANHNVCDIQRCALLSIKTGGCPEDCGYCPQSAAYQAPGESMPLLSVAEVKARAARAKELGATRFCMGAAWRGPRVGPQFDRVLEMVRAVRELGMEACATLGMLTEDQARRLREAGLTAYNHNLDTSRRYYPQIITTRTYDDRLATLRAVHRAGISVCCGGILGMGESEEDRAIQLVRFVATTRITFPRARVRLSAGRNQMSRELQVLCFLAGANSIFFGEKLLTTPNVAADKDASMFQAMGLPLQ
jgi:biotin synthase